MDIVLRQDAIKFATKWHEGQKRKDGKEYITHPIAVAEIAEKHYKSRISGEPNPYQDNFIDDVFIVSVLHDVLEDTKATKKDIVDKFGYYIASMVELLSRKNGQTYFDFIMGLLNEYDLVPIYVKLADLEHNMSTLEEGSLKDKYRFAKHILEGVLTKNYSAFNEVDKDELKSYKPFI